MLMMADKEGGTRVLTVVVVKLGWWCSSGSRLWIVEAVPCRTTTMMKMIRASSSSPTTRGYSSEAWGWG